MHWEQRVEYATLSDIGMRRQNNQDSFAVQLSGDKESWDKTGHLFVVCDGMGGHAVGELASKIAVDTIPVTYAKSRQDSRSEALTEAVEQANRAIFERGSQNRDFKRMGTTCVALVLSPDGATVAHVGDSRCYRVREDRIEQLTFDHSLHWELQKAGRIKPGDGFMPEAKHVITRSLGPESKVEVDIDGPFIVLPDDRFVLCSDGLTGHLSDSEIGMIVRLLKPGEAARLMVNLANLRGGSDNTTVTVAHAGTAPEIADAPAAPAPPLVGPFWMVLLWISLLGIGVGATGIAMQKYVPGAVACGVSVLLFVLLIRHWLRKRRERAADSGEDVTVAQNVYRVASAKPTREFLAGLLKLSGNLHRMATEEEWDVDMALFEKHVTVGRDAVEKSKAETAMREVGLAIEALMPGLHASRKRIRSESNSSMEGASGGSGKG